MPSFLTQGSNPGLPLKADSLLLSHNEIPLHTVTMAIIKTSTAVNAGEGVGEREPSFTAGAR